MRSNLQNSKRLTPRDLRRLASDARHNSMRAVTRVVAEKHSRECKAIEYVLHVMETGKRPYGGNPSLRAQELAKIASIKL